VFHTKRQAVVAFEGWMDLERQRWAEMKRQDPDIFATGVGIGRTRRALGRR